MTHPNQGPTPGHTAPLTNVDVASGVNEQGVGFVQLLAYGATERRALRLVGQLTPAVALDLSRNLAEAAEAAISDGALFAVAKELTDAQGDKLEGRDLEDAVQTLAAHLVGAARRHRGQLSRNQDALELVAEAVADIDDSPTEEAGE